MPVTAFYSALDLVHSTSRVPDGLRSPERTERIDTCTISNRSNYTRVQFDGSNSAAFMIPVGPYAGRVFSTPGATATTFNFIGAFGDSAMASLTPNELRALAYGLLAAANWADTRDTTSGQVSRRPTRQPNWH
jgi:hypothetical protein